MAKKTKVKQPPSQMAWLFPLEKSLEGTNLQKENSNSSEHEQTTSLAHGQRVPSELGPNLLITLVAKYLYDYGYLEAFEDFKVECGQQGESTAWMDGGPFNCDLSLEEIFDEWCVRKSQQGLPLASKDDVGGKERVGSQEHASGIERRRVDKMAEKSVDLPDSRKESVQSLAADRPLPSSSSESDSSSSSSDEDESTKVKPFKLALKSGQASAKSRQTNGIASNTSVSVPKATMGESDATRTKPLVKAKKEKAAQSLGEKKELRGEDIKREPLSSIKASSNDNSKSTSRDQKDPPAKKFKINSGKEKKRLGKSDVTPPNQANKSAADGKKSTSKAVLTPSLKSTAQQHSAPPGSPNSSDSSSSSSSSSDSSSEEAEEGAAAKQAKTLKKKATPFKNFSVSPKNQPVESDDDDISSTASSSTTTLEPDNPRPVTDVTESKDVVAAKPSKKRKRPTTTTGGRDEDEEEGTPKMGSAAKKVRSSNDMASQSLAPRPMPATATPASAQESDNPNNKRFQRVPTDLPVDERFASNAYIPYDYANRAHDDLIVTRGRQFTKEKNKKKRGSYRGGTIDVQGKKGIKFD